MTVEDRINLSTYYIRLGKPEEATRVLEEVPQGQRNFMVLSNLAMANQMAGRLERALPYLEEVIDKWPSAWPGLTAKQLRFYRQAEWAHLYLLRSRSQETIRQPNKPVVTLDPIFPGVRFVGPGGRYEAGVMAPRELEKLPENALSLVMQLMLWLPSDSRLYWMLGEVFNADGDVPTSSYILDKLCL